MSTLKVIKMITGEEIMGDVDRAQESLHTHLSLNRIRCH